MELCNCQAYHAGLATEGSLVLKLLYVAIFVPDLSPRSALCPRVDFVYFTLQL